MTQPTREEASPMRPSPALISGIFASLSHPSRRWTLTRVLQSDNPLDINGELRGTATFTQLPSPSAATSIADPNSTTDILYQEEGEMPRLPGMGPGMGLRFTKKYIWRLSASGRISVWFAKVGNDNEPDYLFHEFDFLPAGGPTEAEDGGAKRGAGESTFVEPPTPPEVLSSSTVSAGDLIVVTARGNHLCINDMYRTAYAFRIRSADGAVLSWASRHVVKGPKKNQDIVNLYRTDI